MTEANGNPAAKTGWDIAQLATAAGVSSRTIRYYGELGLLRAEGRGPGGRRQFGPDALERLRFIGRLKHLGLTLEQIGALNRAFDRGHTPALLDQLEHMLDQRLGEIEQRKLELEQLDTDLRSYRHRIQRRRHPED